MSPATAVAVVAALVVEPPRGATPLEGSTMVASQSRLTPEEKLRQWKRHRAGLIAMTTLSGLVLAGGTTGLGLSGWTARQTGEPPIGPIVGGAALTAAGLGGVIGGWVGLARHNRRRAEIRLGPAQLALRF